MEAPKAWCFGMQYSSDHVNQSPHCHAEKLRGSQHFPVGSGCLWLSSEGSDMGRSRWTPGLSFTL